MSSDERHLAEQEAHAQALVDVAYWRERAERAEAEAGHMEVRGDQWKDAAERAEGKVDYLRKLWAHVMVGWPEIPRDVVDTAMQTAFAEDPARRLDVIVADEIRKQVRG